MLQKLAVGLRRLLCLFKANSMKRGQVVPGSVAADKKKISGEKGEAVAEQETREQLLSQGFEEEVTDDGRDFFRLAGYAGKCPIWDYRHLPFSESEKATRAEQENSFSLRAEMMAKGQERIDALREFKRASEKLKALGFKLRDDVFTD